MVADAPIVVYGKSKDKKGFKKSSAKDVSEAQRRYQEQWGESGGKNIKMSDILGGKKLKML